jgi:outer membrane lipoprotein LolB
VFLSRIIALALAGLLASCALAPALTVVDRAEALPAGATLEHFQLEGRLSARAGDNGFAGTLNWERRADDESLLLATPLGQGVIEIRRDPAGMRLIEPGGAVQVAESGDALLERVLGVRLPVSGLVHWLSARPYPGAAFSAEVDPEGRVIRLVQEGWQIEYGRFRWHAGRWLPGRVIARRADAFELRLVIDHWASP